ncbi:nephrin isoform X2 [Neodiprion lecontei]|uniref:Nephrin isoform X2 n=1 Tax=Neodiprion lecontei TaxID=441921 RepID=A0ABM3GKL5_NEOLC|nr:nephrin isoform X2 [Neodiprion fabricii]XP_046600809.1 nephrin isoform X2 [Neodiprion lecontei]
MWWVIIIPLLGLTAIDAVVFAARVTGSSPQKLAPLVDVTSVEGQNVELSCDISPPIHDKLHMVLWYKNDDGVPIYTFDVRGRSLEHAEHKSELFGSRAYFRTAVQQPAVLVIDQIKRHDAASYRCRVDFRKAQTRSFRYNLTVIVPPELPAILDRWGRVLNDSVGPYQEGDELLLNCRVIGGKPPPLVRWLINGIVRDQESEIRAGDVIENRLTLSSISRSDLGTRFTCQALNTKLVEPKTASLILEMNLKPLTVKIKKPGSTTTTINNGIGEALRAGKLYKVACETTGSRPPAIITWYEGQKLLMGDKRKPWEEETRENRTVSLLSFQPRVEDNGKTITCRAENRNVTGLHLETSWVINVEYPPIVSLRLGLTLSPEDIKEGVDVYFECHVKANPPWRKLTWYHNNELLVHNSSAKTIISNQSLALQTVTRGSAGLYICAASNDLGETRSEPLPFRVKFTPVCKDERVIVVGASKGESLDVVCRVEAHPPAHSFRWKFNNSGETLEVVSSTHRVSNNGVSSTLRYTLSSERDYGTLSCWADNAVGSQTKPCLFQLVAAGKPSPVRNCSLANQTYTSVEVRCVPGYDGGLPQRFVLEVFHGDVDFLSSTQPLYNVSNLDEPVFSLAGIEATVDAGVHVAVYAVNAKGRSTAVVLSEVTFRDAEKRTGQHSGMAMSPLIGVAVGAAVTLGSVVLVVMIRARRERVSKTRNHEKTTEINDVPNSQQYPLQNIQTTIETDPDVIPNKFGGGNLVEVSPPSYQCQIGGYPPGQWVTPGPTPSIDELCQKFAGRPTELRLPSRSTIPCMPGVVVCGAQGVIVAGECLDGEAIKRRLMANRLPESCV